MRHVSGRDGTTNSSERVLPNPFADRNINLLGRYNLVDVGEVKIVSVCELSMNIDERTYQSPELMTLTIDSRGVSFTKRHARDMNILTIDDGVSSPGPARSSNALRLTTPVKGTRMILEKAYEQL
jgi:hypothetical protein